MLNIAFLGNFEVPFSTENDHAWTYRKLGHEVYTFQENRARGEEILAVAKNCDLFIYTHTHGWETPGIEEVLAELKRRKIPTFGYHLDLWMGINRQKDLDSDPFWKCDYFFTVDKAMVEFLNSRPELPEGIYLPPGVIERDCFIGKPRKEFEYDVAFVGSYGYHPEWPYRPQLIDWLKKTYGEDFGHFGGDGLGTIRGHDLNDLYASVKVVVGDSLNIGFQNPFYWSDRVYETTGRGGFLIHPYIFGLSKEFVPGKELVFYDFGNFDQLRSRIDYYLMNDAGRESIKLAGHNKTKNNYTYTNRITALLSTLAEKNPAIREKLNEDS